MGIFSLDVGGSMVKYGLFDDSEHLVSYGKVQTDHSLPGQSLPAQLEKLYYVYGENAPLIGVSCSGQIDTRSGTVAFATQALPGMMGFPIRPELEKRLGASVWVENDVNCAAVGEGRFGAARELPSFLCLTYGTGIGGAIMENGSLLRGSRGSAGEFGHICVEHNGRKCGCGQAGCYEAYASARALIQDASRIFQREISPDDFYEELHKGTPAARKAFEYWLDYAICGLASLIHSFDPQAVVLGGKMMERREIVEKIREQLPRRLMASYRQVEVIPAALGNKAGLYGAMYLAKAEIKCRKASI